MRPRWHDSGKPCANKAHQVGWQRPGKAVNAGRARQAQAAVVQKKSGHRRLLQRILCIWMQQIFALCVQSVSPQCVAQPGGVYPYLVTRAPPYAAGCQRKPLRWEE